MLGLAMYTSYFILFFALFQTLYLNKKQKRQAQHREAPAASPDGKPSAPADAAAAPAPARGQFEGWAVGKGQEIEIAVETSSEVFLDVCASG